MSSDYEYSDDDAEYYDDDEEMIDGTQGEGGQCSRPDSELERFSFLLISTPCR